MKNRKTKNQHGRATPSNHAAGGKSHQPFVEHLHELRRRLYIVAGSILVWGGAAYGVQQQIVGYLLKPAHGQKFIYTSPGGGIDFLFRVCIYAGIALSLPLMVYQLLKFLAPIMDGSARRFIALASLCSGMLAVGGMAFGYFLGLPAALHFLLNQFTTIQIKPLVTIQSYLGFVLAYMLGSALLFQLPIILLFINRIKPLKPSKLLSLKHQRWVIVAAFVLAGLMNPSPNIVSQLIVAVPFIVMYQLGIILVALANRNVAQRLAEHEATAVAEQQFAEIVNEEPEFLPTPVAPQPRQRAPLARGTFMDFRPATKVGAQPQLIHKPKTISVIDAAEVTEEPQASLQIQPLLDLTSSSQA